MIRNVYTLKIFYTWWPKYTNTPDLLTTHGPSILKTFHLCQKHNCPLDNFFDQLSKILTVFELPIELFLMSKPYTTQVRIYGFIQYIIIWIDYSIKVLKLVHWYQRSIANLLQIIIIIRGCFKMHIVNRQYYVLII